MKYLIAGLGNFGPEYDQTRHNVGFMVLDQLASETGLSFELDRLGLVAQGRIKNKQIILLKPTTYMNLSGKAVKHWMKQFNIPLENLLVVTDDLAISEGMIRLKGKGSDGGHNGLKSIAEQLESSTYPRLRFGIGSEFGRGKQVNFVLGKWSDDEVLFLKPSIDLASQAVKAFVLSGLPFAMNNFNNKGPGSDS